MLSFKLFVEKHMHNGTYAGLRFDETSQSQLEKFNKKHKIPSPVSPDKLHVTLLYSRKYLPDYTAAGELKHAFYCSPKEFVVWNTNGENKAVSKCLILKLDCPELVQYHNHLMELHGATFDYKEYQPHVTLSYNIGDLDVDLLHVADLPRSLTLSYEYQEVLDLDWASKL